MECLGDIARYRMAVTTLIENQGAAPKALPANPITRAALSGSRLSPAPGTPEASALSDRNIASAGGSPVPVARIDDSPPPSVGEAPPHPEFAPSVGIVAARLMELDPEKDRWRQLSKEWYAKGLAVMPTMGRLHHHLGMLSWDREGSEKEELRAVYHFVKRSVGSAYLTV
jgi:protein SMG6